MLSYIQFAATAVTFLLMLFLLVLLRGNFKLHKKLFDLQSERMDGHHTRISLLEKRERAREIINQPGGYGAQGVTPGLSAQDPLIGWYDRVLAEGDEQKIGVIRNIPFVLGRELEGGISIARHKEHIVSNGYGSHETVDALWPDEPAKEDKGEGDENC